MDNGPLIDDLPIILIIIIYGLCMIDQLRMLLFAMWNSHSASFKLRFFNNEPTSHFARCGTFSARRRNASFSSRLGRGHQLQWPCGPPKKVDFFPTKNHGETSYIDVYIYIWCGNTARCGIPRSSPCHWPWLNPLVYLAAERSTMLLRTVVTIYFD